MGVDIEISHLKDGGEILFFECYQTTADQGISAIEDTSNANFLDRTDQRLIEVGFTDLSSIGESDHEQSRGILLIIGGGLFKQFLFFSKRPPTWWLFSGGVMKEVVVFH